MAFSVKDTFKSPIYYYLIGVALVDNQSVLESLGGTNFDKLRIQYRGGSFKMYQLREDIIVNLGNGI